MAFLAELKKDLVPKPPACTGFGTGTPVNANATGTGTDATETPVKWGDAYVPRWAWEPLALDPIRNCSDRPYKAMGMAAYPTWKFAMLTTILLWSFWGVHPFVAYVSAACKQDDGLAGVPVWVPSLFVPVLGMALVLEFFAHKWILPAFSIHLGAYKVGPFVVPFKLYLIAAFALSMISDSDLVTTGMTAARLLKSEHCAGGASQWNGLAGFSIAVWLGMIVQFAIGLGHGIPIPHEKSSKTALDLWRAKEPCGPDYIKIHTMLGAPCKPAEQMQALAAASRMTLLTFRYETWIMTVFPPELEERAAMRHRFVTCMQKKTQWAVTALLLENSMQVILQSSVMSVEVARGSSVDTLTMASFSLSIFNLLKNVVTSALTMKNMALTIWKYCQDDDEADKRAEIRWPDEYMGGSRGRRCRVILAVTVYSAAAVITILLSAHAVFKVASLL